MNDRQARAPTPIAAVIGAGPAGLMAAETLALRGAQVSVFDRMPSPARKFLLAGRGGLNITHSEDSEAFLSRYGEAAARLRPALEAFPPQALRDWCAELGEETFVGSSGRVFPKSFKASPLLRAWLRRLEALGVRLRAREMFERFDAEGRPVMRDADGATHALKADAVVFALGGASWPRLGSDGGWQAAFETQGVAVSPLRPANCGFEIAWSQPMRERFAGAPLKNVRLDFEGTSVRGEAVIADTGLEGGAVYALSGRLREAIAAHGSATLRIDLRPDVSEAALAGRLARARPGESLSNLLRKAAGLPPAAAALARESATPPREPAALAARIKSVALPLLAPRPIGRAISSAGGIPWVEISEDFSLARIPHVFVAGEMLDWEAPTGGYLLQACFSTGKAAGEGAARRLGL